MTVTIKLKSEPYPKVHGLVQNVQFENNNKFYCLYIGERKQIHRYRLKNIEYITEDRSGEK